MFIKKREGSRDSVSSLYEGCANYNVDTNKSIFTWCNLNLEKMDVRDYITIKNEIDFKEKFLQCHQIDSEFLNEKFYYENFIPDSQEDLNVTGFALKGGCFTNINLSRINFINCSFENLDIEDWQCGSFYNCIFNQCEIYSSSFIGCELVDCQFNQVSFIHSRFSDTILRNVEFTNCGIVELAFLNSDILAVRFTDCEIYNSRFERFTKGTGDVLNFSFCEIKSCSFIEVDLTHSKFTACKFEYCRFLNSKFNKRLFDDHSTAVNESLCSIDIQSIILSEDQPLSVLRNIFGIHSDDVKQYLSDLTTPINYYKVFISYSFKDKEFAKRMNEALRLKGVSTFLWENDAPGGKYLKSIMSDNIQQYDKLLFIASENSIKSSACQFELSEARDKQNKYWDTIYFPIHIDNFLFKLKKHEIRPKEKQDEFWANIEELRDINSTDFSQFVDDEYNRDAFLKAINKLVKALKKHG